MSKQVITTIEPSEPSTELLNMLKADHDKIKELFEQFERTADQEERGAIIRSALKGLEVHAELEEKIFYPAIRERLRDDKRITASFEEHHLVHLLINELKVARVKLERRDAKFTVLAENVKQHIKQEEESLFLEALAIDLNWESLSTKVEKRKTQLESQESYLNPRH